VPRVARRHRYDDGGGSTRGYRAGGGGFSPLLLGADFWLDATVPASIVGANPVTRWKDQTANARDFVPGGVQPQTSGVNNIGGKNAITFNGVAGSFMNSNGVAWNHPAQYSYFIVFVSTAVAGVSWLVLDTDSNTGQRQAMGEGLIAVDQMGMFAGNAGSPTAAAPQPVAAASWVYVFNDPASTIYKGGAVFAGPGTAGGGTYNFPQRIGADNVTGNPFAGSIGEVFGVPGVPSAATIAGFTTYAHAKWGTP
jgi:hypothetical protein